MMNRPVFEQIYQLARPYLNRWFFTQSAFGIARKELKEREKEAER